MATSPILGPPGFDFSKINALKFAEIWNNFDKDRSGCIEGEELEEFMRELAKKILQKEPTVEEYKSLRATLMSAYDSKGDGKISITELAQMLLPHEEMFLLLFRRTIPLTSTVDFLKVWRKYDENSSGYLTVLELTNFVQDLVIASGKHVHGAKVSEYAASIMELYDRNEDGLLDLKDMASLLKIPDNFLLQFRIEDSTRKERKRDFEKIFAHYDVGKTGALEGLEIDGFVKDMMETIRDPLSARELQQFKMAVLNHCDTNKDGKIQKKELALCLGIHLGKS